jgi:hypothetical protein
MEAAETSICPNTQNHATKATAEEKIPEKSNTHTVVHVH